MKTGIYTIENLIDGKLYIGYAKDIPTRCRKHRERLITNKHENSHLQNAVNLYSIHNFLFDELELCEEQFLCSQEHYWCIMLDTHNRENGYNIRPTYPHGLPAPMRGRKFTEEHKYKLSLAHKGKPKSEESKRKNAEWHRGRTTSKKGKTLSDEIKRKMSESRKGYKVPEEVKQKIKETMKKCRKERFWSTIKIK